MKKNPFDRNGLAYCYQFFALYALADQALRVDDGHEEVAGDQRQPNVFHQLKRAAQQIMREYCSQFHQRFLRIFFIPTSFWQFFSSYMYVVKAAETYVCTKNSYVKH